MAGDKDSCMLKCHVFRCDVPAKAIASALHGLCAQVRAKSGAGNVGMGLKLLRWLGQGSITLPQFFCLLVSHVGCIVF